MAKKCSSKSIWVYFIFSKKCKQNRTSYIVISSIYIIICKISSEQGNHTPELQPDIILLSAPQTRMSKKDADYRQTFKTSNNSFELFIMSVIIVLFYWFLNELSHTQSVYTYLCVCVHVQCRPIIDSDIDTAADNHDDDHDDDANNKEDRSFWNIHTNINIQM